MAFAGTSVVGGRGEGIVVAIGTGTEVGRIAGRLAGAMERRSPLQHELDRLVRILLVVAIGLIAIVSGLGFVRGQSLGANVLAGISAAIAAIPEEPPVLLAVILGLGAYRLLKRGVLVRRLNAEEVLGAIDLIVTDKTGTLTLNRLDVASIRDADRPDRGPGRPARRARHGASRRGRRLGPGRRHVARLVHAGARTGARRRGRVARLPAEELVDAEPPTADRPISITSRAGTGAWNASPRARRRPSSALDTVTADPDRTRWHEELDAGAVAGERLIGIARADGREGAAWRMVALIGFADPLRPGIGAALREAQEAGIQTIVVTGDHPATAAAIARSAGLGWERIETGADLAAWDDERLARELPGLHIVARSTPEQKERIVRVARANGRLVAVTGDGVNDAPALHNADVAVAMGSGTAVAREAADLVLGDDSFATLLYGLREGRRIVDNVQKGLVFLVSTHVAFLGLHPDRDDRRVRAAAAADPDPVDGAVHRLVHVDRVRAGARRAERHVPAAAQARGAAPGHGDPAPDRARRRLHGRRRPVAHALGLRPPRAHALARLHGARLRAGRPGVREPEPADSRSSGSRGTASSWSAGSAVVVIQAAIPFIPAVADAFRASPLDPVEWLLVAAIALAPAAVAELIRFRGRTAWVA